jgi:hypothetical protein
MRLFPSIRNIFVAAGMLLTLPAVARAEDNTPCTPDDLVACIKAEAAAESVHDDKTFIVARRNQVEYYIRQSLPPLAVDIYLKALEPVERLMQSNNADDRKFAEQQKIELLKLRGNAYDQLANDAWSKNDGEKNENRQLALKDKAEAAQLESKLNSKIVTLSPAEAAAAPVSGQATKIPANETTVAEKTAAEVAARQKQSAAQTTESTAQPELTLDEQSKPFFKWPKRIRVTPHPDPRRTAVATTKPLWHRVKASTIAQQSLVPENPGLSFTQTPSPPGATAKPARQPASRTRTPRTPVALGQPTN